jgi:serine-type D-Ala-D-Ala carboxypeptidase
VAGLADSDTLDRLVRQEIADRLFPGIEILVARGDDVLLHRSWGTLDGDGAHPLECGTIFDLASLTKPVATAAVLMTLVDQGALRLDDPVRRHIPDFGGDGKDRITLRHLASHTAGLPATEMLLENFTSRDAALAHLLALPLAHAPATQMVYSCLGYLILGEVIERVTGAPLAEQFRDRIAAPLGMADTTFSPISAGLDTHRIAPTGRCPWRGKDLRGVVHDSNSYLFGGQGGNAGLFSTATDLLAFARMLLGGGQSILSAAALAELFCNQNPQGLTARSIGWEVQTGPGDAASCGPDFATGAIGHTGYTGTSLWIDPVDRRIVIALSNRVFYSHADTVPRMVAFRERLHRLAGGPYSTTTV